MNINTKKTRFATVAGDDTPEDMLRYDLGFTNPAHPGIVAFPCFKTRAGNLGGKFTPGRWQSFARPITEILDPGRLEELRGELSRDPKAWTTYRHPVKPDGGRDYANLTPRTLKEFLLAEAPDTDNL